MSDDAAPTSPEAAVLAALHAMDAMQHARTVALVDADSLGDLFKRQCEAVRPHTLERFAEDHPELAPEQRPAAFEQFRRVVGDPMVGVADMFPGVRTHADFAALDPAYYLLRYLERHDMRVDLVQRLRARGRSVPAELLCAPPHKGYDVLGSVVEEPDLAHVLYRVVSRPHDAPEYRGQVEIVSTRRQADDTWRLLAVDLHFLEPRGGSVGYIPEEYADLYEEEMMGSHLERRARLEAQQSE